MVAIGEELSERVARLYDTRGDVDVADLVGSLRDAVDDESLAELIDTDGRLRLARGLPVELSRYLDAVPDLAMMPVALDAAIEFTLRAIADSGNPSAAAVEALIADYPMLEQPIRAASLLSDALWSTTQVRAEAAPVEAPHLPADFGPLMASGRARYELRDLIGSGAQGSVYLAVDRHLSDTTKPAWVAIKLLRRHVGDGSGRERLIEEATRARRINHPNVVRVLDRGVSEEGHDYIVYEYVEGTTLRGWLNDHAGRISPRVAAEMAAKVAQGVQAAHAVGVVHCDIKPDNILVTRAGEPKVADFGVAVRFEEDDASMPRAGHGPVGNLAFIAPEQYHVEEGAIAPPADIYACGGVLYYLLTGGAPNGRSVDDVERNFDRSAGRATPPSVLPERPDADVDLDAICGRALAVRAAGRYQSAEGLANDLQRWLRHEPLGWTRTSSRRRVMLLWRRQPLALILLFVVIATAAIAGGLGVRMNHSAERRLMEQKVAAAKRLAFETAEYRKRMLDGGATLLQVSDAKGSASVRSNWITMVTIMEAVVGPKLVGEADQWKTIWDRRIEIVRGLVDDGLAGGGTPSLETLTWQTVLGMFLLREGAVEEADAVLAESQGRWSTLLAPDDPWLIYIELMRACCTISKADTQFMGKRADGATLEQVRAAAGTMDRHAGLFKDRRNGDAVHRLVLENLAKAHDTHLLNDSKARRVVEEALRKILD